MSNIGNPSRFTYRKQNFLQEDDIASDADETDYGEYSVAWVLKRYSPLDERPTVPVVSRVFKPCKAGRSCTPPRLTTNMQQLQEPTGRFDASFSRHMPAPDGAPGVRGFSSTPSTRCEEWSTLKQMLPSRGDTLVPQSTNWGTGGGRPPTSVASKSRFPAVASPMSRCVQSKETDHSNDKYGVPLFRYIDDMYSSDRLFKLF